MFASMLKQASSQLPCASTKHAYVLYPTIFIHQKPLRWQRPNSEHPVGAERLGWHASRPPWRPKTAIADSSKQVIVSEAENDGVGAKLLRGVKRLVSEQYLPLMLLTALVAAAANVRDQCRSPPASHSDTEPEYKPNHL